MFLIKDYQLWAQCLSSWRGVRLCSVDWGKEKMLESPSSLGLGTIYIVPLRGRTDLTTKVWVWSLGIEMGRC